MKTLYFLVGLSLMFLFLACEPHAIMADKNDISKTDAMSEVSETTVDPVATEKLSSRDQLINSTTTKCLDSLEHIGAVDLNGEMLIEDLELAIPSHAHDTAYYLNAMPYSDEGDEMIKENLLWDIADSTLAKVTSHAWNNGIVEITTLRDWFDADGVEPTSVAAVCVQNACDPKAHIVYSKNACTLFRVVGLIDVAGTWLIHGSMFSEPQQIAFTQKGREVVATPLLADQSEAELTDNVLRFHANHYQYHCTLTSRTHCEGKHIDVQTGIAVGWWVADRQ